jgi:hypothetical protein
MRDGLWFGARSPYLHECRVALLVFAACLTAPAGILAQGTGDDTSRKSKDFELVLTVPFLYSSSVVRSDTDVVVGDTGDKHADPDLALEWSRQFSKIKLSTLVAATLERYAKVREANTDTFTASVKAELTDGRSDLFVPYFQYEQTMGFTPFFRKREDTLHDLALGFTSGIGFGKDWDLIAYSKADEPGRSSLKFDVQAGRRFADPRDLDRVFIEVNLDFVHTISEQWSVGVTPAFKARWYDNYFGELRRDYRPSVELKAEWTPGWLTKQLPEAAIEFIVLFERNYSNLADQRYKLWELGPTIILTSKF